MGTKGYPPRTFYWPKEVAGKNFKGNFRTYASKRQVIDLPEMFRMSVASGRGIGKSALVAWINPYGCYPQG
jgi:hypothetical protein